MGRDAGIIVVGGGASTLADDLLANGFDNLTVLDLSAAALVAAQKRLGSWAGKVQWIEADITRVNFSSKQFDVWHDRAVFHFLTSPEERAAYVLAVFQSVKPRGHVIVATFAEDGPEKCSGLPVMRYSADGLHAEFGESFLLLNHRQEAYYTPFWTVQQLLPQDGFITPVIRRGSDIPFASEKLFLIFSKNRTTTAAPGANQLHDVLCSARYFH